MAKPLTCDQLVVAAEIKRQADQARAARDWSALAALRNVASSAALEFSKLPGFPHAEFITRCGFGPETER